jgi:hypothetical protein
MKKKNRLFYMNLPCKSNSLGTAGIFHPPRSAGIGSWTCPFHMFLHQNFRKTVIIVLKTMENIVCTRFGPVPARTEIESACKLQVDPILLVSGGNIWTLLLGQ